MSEFKLKSAIIAILLAGAFAAGRYSVSKPEIKETIADKKTDQKVENKDTKSTTVTKVIQKPDGTKETDTTTVVDTKVHDTDNSSDLTNTKIDVIPPKTGTFNISALGAYSNGSMTYGASVTKQVLGPVTAGVFGLTNGTFGVSIGMSF